ncbi:MAG: hypothetical protein AAF604_16045 [Acidobacteriota bacterium]
MRILELLFHWLTDLESQLDRRPATVRVVADFADHPLVTMLWEDRRLCLCHASEGPRLHRVLADEVGVDPEWVLGQLRTGGPAWVDRLVTSGRCDAAALRRALGLHVALTLTQSARLALDHTMVSLEVEHQPHSRRTAAFSFTGLEVLTLAARSTLEGVVEAGQPPTGFIAPLISQRRSLCFLELPRGRLKALPLAVTDCPDMTLQEALGAYREARAAIAPAPLESTGLTPEAAMMRRANRRGLVVFYNPPYLTTVETARPSEAVTLLSLYLSKRPAQAGQPRQGLAPELLKTAVGG